MFRTHPRGLVYAAVFSVVLIGLVKTHVGTQAIPPPPPPLLSWEKIQRAVTIGPTHILSLDDCIPWYTCDP
jgi:hypothetical protein